jgi:hypothetical protein
MIGLMNKELERIWKEWTLAQFKVHGGTEENHEEPHREHPVSEPRFEPTDSWKQSAKPLDRDVR